MFAAIVLRWIWLFLPLTLSHASTDSFSVEVPKAPVSGLYGGSVFLPCTVTNNIDVRQFEVRWYRPSMYITPVFLYKSGQIEETSANKQYLGRVSLLGALEKGDVSLKLDNLTTADEGIYMCHVSSDSWYDKSNMSLKIRAVGSTPILSVADARGGQVNVSCHSHGWLPKPSLNWRDKEGRDLKHLSKDKFTEDSEGLVSVSSWLIVSPAESGWLSCFVALSASREEGKESRVLPHTPTEPWKGPFIGIVVLLVLFIIGLAVYFVVQKGLDVKRKKSGSTEETVPLNSSSVEKDQPKADIGVIPYPAVSIAVSPEEQNHHIDHPTQMPAETVPLNSSPVEKDLPKPEAVEQESPEEQNLHTDQPTQIPTGQEPAEHNSGTEEIQREAVEQESPEEQNLHTDQPTQIPTGQEPAEHNSGTEEIQREAVEQESPEEQNLHTDQPTQIPTELDQVKKSKVDISIDSAEAPAFFRLTHGGKRIHCTHPKEDHEEEKYRIFTFCKEKFSSGKHYWEVKIGEKPKEKLSWYVGVMSETAENVYRDSLIPKNGFWVLCYEAERGVHFRDFPAPKPLPDVSDELTTVGVFLDCDEHTLSFYDVGAKSHIYTFTNMKSKTSLCPLISPGIRDKTPIKIC